jgi:hypothetical protein
LNNSEENTLNQTKRNEQYLKLLVEFIYKEYGLSASSITPAKRGFYGETWRMDTSNHKYFLKLVYCEELKNMYERSFPIMEHLYNHGIDFISRIIKTADGRLSTQYDGAVLGVYNWIDGKNIETDETKVVEYQMLAKIYNVPHYGIKISYEDFSDRSADEFFHQWKALNDTQINLLFIKNRTKLEYRAERLKYFADLCRGDTTGFFITHGDAGGNVITNGDKYFIVDWDSSCLAPPERDAWEWGFRDWAKCLFNKTLHQNGINYTLRMERMAYYCYHIFFFCLSSLTKYSPVEEIESFFNDWGEERIEYADKLFSKKT